MRDDERGSVRPSLGRKAKVGHGAAHRKEWRASLAALLASMLTGRRLLRIMEASSARDGARCVLLALCHHADGAGVSRPTQRELIAFSGVQERQVRNILRDLGEMGEIRLLQEGRGRGHPSVYRVIEPGRPIPDDWPEQWEREKGHSTTPFEAAKRGNGEPGKNGHI